MEKKKKATKKKVVKNDLDNKAGIKVKAKKTAPKKESPKVEKLDKNKTYSFISNGKAERLPKGSVWSVTGETAEIYLRAGYGDLK